MVAAIARPENWNVPIVRVQSGSVQLIAEIASEWRQLCNESSDQEISYRPEWTESYLRAFEPDAEVTMITAWAGMKLRGVLPLVRHRVTAYGLPITKLTVPANVHSLRAGLTVCPGEERADVLQMLWQTAKNLQNWDVIDVSNVVGNNDLDRLLALAKSDGFLTARKRTSQSLYLKFETSSSVQAPWMNGTRPKFRSHLRRAKRQLAEQGPLVLCHYDAADPAALSKFYDLEASGWKGTNGTAIKCDPQTRQFYDLVANAAEHDHYLSLDFLELNGKPIAGNFGFNWQGKYYLAKAAYDETYKHHGPGHLLVYEILNESLQRGLHEFDFCGPATWDESRWASSRRTNYRIFIFRKSLYGRLLHALRISAWDKLKKLLRRPQDDESAPLELQSRPQGNNREQADA